MRFSHVRCIGTYSSHVWSADTNSSDMYWLGIILLTSEYSHVGGVGTHSSHVRGGSTKSSHVRGICTHSSGARFIFAHVREIGTNTSPPEKQVTGATTTYELFYMFINANKIFTYAIYHRYQLCTCLRSTNFHAREQIAPVLHRCEEYFSIIHISQ